MNRSKSNALFDEAKKSIVGGVNSPVRAFRSVGQTPLFIARAKGSHIFDADGNEYIDYVGSWGPCILGHADDRVVKAVRDAAENGLTFGAPTEGETMLAERIRAAYPPAEKVRLVSSGTEAVMSAIRAARGFTGREKILKFKGCYHGHSDGLLVRAGSGLLTDSVPDSAGVPKSYVQNTLLADYNDADSVKQLFALHDDIAAVIIEPVAANMGVIPPKPGFLAFLRDITQKHGALLIFDEVITGFRLAYGGAWEYYGISPDLVIFGKIVGGGMPLAAYGGWADVMAEVAPEGPVYQAGTLSGNPVSVAAGLKTLEILSENREIYAELKKKAARLELAWKAKGLRVNREGSLVSAFFTERTVERYDDALDGDTAAFAAYFAHMLEQGIYLAPSMFEAVFLSAAHTEDDIEQTVCAIGEYRPGGTVRKSGGR